MIQSDGPPGDSGVGIEVVEYSVQFSSVIMIVSGWLSPAPLVVILRGAAWYASPESLGKTQEDSKASHNFLAEGTTRSHEYFRPRAIEARGAPDNARYNHAYESYARTPIASIH